MAQVYIGSARHDENGKLNGKEGDQLQTGSGNDFKGEVSMQAYYTHKLGWDGLRFIDIAFRHKAAERMVAATNNANIGYSQRSRNQIISNGINTKKKTNCDCSSLLREVFIETTGKDPGVFSTADAKTVLLATGLVKSITVAESDLQLGDILITKKKGHCAVVVLGKTPEEPKKDIYYPAYLGRGTSIVSALETVGEKDSSFAHRRKIALANGFKSYSGTIKENMTLLAYLKCGKLKKA
jgi:hypothetical protein